MIHENESKAFTLIELLIVVAIIGILAAIAVPNFLNAQVRAKIAACKGEMKTAEQALEMYRMDNNGVYMVRDSNLGGNDAGVFYHTYVWNHITTPIGYLTRYPLDPFYREGEWISQLPPGPSYQGVVVSTRDIDYLPYA
ncbi:MAG: prepilin-type N-terminal cleavage/methylation domain-containing protein, partial [bacterium]